MEQYRDFFALVLPLGTPDAYCNVHYQHVFPDGRAQFRGYPAQGLSAFIRNAEMTAKRHGGSNIYFCLSSQSEVETRDGPRGEFKVAKRDAKHAVTLKAFFVDLDVKPGNPEAFPTPKAALEALGEFVTRTGIPKPNAIVASGSGGFHIYWGLTDPLPAHKWQVAADALKAAAIDLKFKIDMRVTADAARVLRVPGTKNHKTNPPGEVKLLRIGAPITAAAMLKPLLPWVKKPELPPRPPTSEGGELYGGMEGGKAEPVPLDALALECAFIAQTIRTGGDGYEEPLWRSCMAVAAHTPDPMESALILSAGHEGFTEEATALKLQYAIDKKVGWPLCTTIAKDGAEECKTCPHFGKVKTPFHLVPKGVTPQVPVVASTDMPQGYVRNADGMILKVMINEDGSATHIGFFDYPIINGWLQDESSSRGWMLHFDTKIAGKTKKFSAVLEELFGRGGVQILFAAHGMPVGDANIKPLKDFLMAWTKKLQLTKDAVVGNVSMGWSFGPNGKPNGFSYAGQTLFKDGTSRPATTASPRLADQYTPAGDMDRWRDAVELVCGQRRPELNAILATGFAGPLTMFTGQDGLLMSTFSTQSGVGKTTAMRTAAAVWGHGKKTTGGLDDTDNQLFGKMGELKSLPVYWDEMQTTEDADKFVRMVFRMSGGKGKGRMNSNTTLRDVGTWNTMLISGANSSLVEPMTKMTRSHNAGLYRVFEYHVDKVADEDALGVVPSAVASPIVQRLEQNWGHAGLIYAKFLAENCDRIAHEVEEYGVQLAKELNADREERYWVACICALMKGAEYANALGLVDMDLDELREFLLSVVARMRGEVTESPQNMADESSIKNVLAQYLNSMRARNTLVTDRVWQGQGRAGGIKIQCDASKLDTITVQRGLDDNTVRLSTTAMSRWLSNHGYSSHAFGKALREEFGARSMYGRLGSGTTMAGGTERLYELDFNDLKLKDFFE